MSDSKIKMQVGDHIFEAEGPADLVRSQFEVFKELIKEHSNPTVTTIISAAAPSDMDKIFRVNGRLVSLRVVPTLDTEAVLLVLYGQRHYRKNMAVTGSELVDSLNYDTAKVRPAVATLLLENAITSEGEYRGKRYSLTDQGLYKAEEVVRRLLKSPF